MCCMVDQIIICLMPVCRYRVVSEIEGVEKEVKELNKEYSSLQSDIARLDTLLAKNRG